MAETLVAIDRSADCYLSVHLTAADIRWRHLFVSESVDWRANHRSISLISDWHAQNQSIITEIAQLNAFHRFTVHCAPDTWRAAWNLNATAWRSNVVRKLTYKLTWQRCAYATFNESSLSLIVIKFIQRTEIIFQDLADPLINSVVN